MLPSLTPVSRAITDVILRLLGRSSRDAEREIEHLRDLVQSDEQQIKQLRTTLETLRSALKDAQKIGRQLEIEATRQRAAARYLRDAVDAESRQRASAAAYAERIASGQVIPPAQAAQKAAEAGSEHHHTP